MPSARLAHGGLRRRCQPASVRPCELSSAFCEAKRELQARAERPRVARGLGPRKATGAAAAARRGRAVEFVVPLLYRRSSAVLECPGSTDSTRNAAACRQSAGRSADQDVPQSPRRCPNTDGAPVLDRAARAAACSPAAVAGVPRPPVCRQSRDPPAGVPPLPVPHSRCPRSPVSHPPAYRGSR